VSRQLLGHHAKEPDAPALDDVPGWLAFLAAKGRSGSAPPELRRKIAEARLAILRAQQTKIERQNQIEAGKMMPTADACRYAGEACAFFFSELERWAREFPPGMAGGDSVSIAKKLTAAVESLRVAAQSKFDAVGGKT